MNAKRLIGSLVVGLAFAFPPWFVFGGRLGGHDFGGGEYLGWIITIISLPGLFTDVAASGNVHGSGNIVVAVLGNFLFYFLAVYLISAIRGKRKAHSSLVAPNSGHLDP